MMKRVSVLFSVLLILGLQITSFAEITPVADRTTEVRDAIVTAAGANSAGDVTDAQLSAITSLDLREKGISELKSGDFSGMSGLTNLNLYNNELSSLPDGIFEGLTALTTLRLGGNTVDPMPITISLEKVGEDQFKAVVPTGAPFSISIPISATNGSISGDTTSLTISTGTVESSAVTVTRTAETTAAVTANIGTLPSLPAINHYGYALSKLDSLPIEVIGMVSTTDITNTTDMTDTMDDTDTDTDTVTNAAPVFADGTLTTRTIVERTEAGVNIGNAVSATDADNDSLTYTLSGINADSFSIDSDTGQLKTKSVLDYETKRIYIVSVNASDETLTSTISVIISVIDRDDTPAVSTMLSVSDRTTQVRDAIIAAVPVIDAANVTEAHLAAITSLNLRDVGISELKTGDFSGLTGLTSLNLYGNMLRNLPVRIFEGLTSLTSIRLGGNIIAPMPLMVSLQQVSDNQFRAIIPTGAPFDIVLPINGASINTVTISKGSVTSESFAATTTDVIIGNLPSLPVNHFGYILAKSTVCNRTIQVSDALVSALQGIDDCRNISEADLATITALDLSNASIISLQADDFSGLFSLETLNLANNQLENLPDSVFVGLSSLTSLDLSGNTVDPLPLNMTIQKVGENGIRIIIPTGAPYDITLPITVANGSLNDNATSITIPIGSIVSQSFTVSRTPNTYDAVTVSIGSLPSLPTGHTGYALILSDQTPFEIFKALNVAPEFTEGESTTRSIAERTVTDVNIGSPISATDDDDDSLTYTVSGTDATSFDIDPTTGQLKTKAPLDYETKTSYMVTVTVSDETLSNTIVVTINVTDIDDNRRPTFTEGDSATRIVAENTSAGVDIGSPVSATDPDDDTLAYSLGGPDAASFSIDSTSGQIRTKVSLDYETKSSYSVAVDVSDDEFSDSIAVTINIADIDETTTDVNDGTPNNAPIFTEGESTTRSVAENTGSGVDIGNPVSATDEDKDTLSYSLGGTDALSFSISSVNGQLRTNAALNYEMKSSYSVTITVSDGNDGSNMISVTINITDVDEVVNTAPVFTEGESASRSVLENTGLGVDIGNAVSATDANDDTLNYSLGGTDASSFSIDSSSGQLRTSASLDYETKSSYSVTITVSDGNGGSDTISVMIDITDVDETTNTAPVFTDGSSTMRTIDENTGSGIDIGSPVSATDADDDTLSYSLGGTDGSSFSIDSSSGQLRTSDSLDYETKSSYSVTITVSDGEGGIDSIVVTINITDVDETTNTAPVFTGGSSTSRAVDENTGSGVDIGSTVSASDADNDTLTYSLGGTDGSSFSIDSSSGQLRTSASLDYETKSSYTVTISVSDGNGGSASITVTIDVNDIDESPANNAPVFTDGSSATRTIAENTATNVNIGSAVSATDTDDDTLSYSLSGTDATSFSIDSTNGQLKTNAALKFETKNSYVVTVTASDNQGGSANINVTIKVTNVNEAPIFTAGASTTRTIAENVPAGINIGSVVSATDVDSTTLTYTLGGTNGASFDIESTTGQLKTKAALDYETKTSYSVTITVSDGSLTDSIVVTINIRDLDETPSNVAPVFTDGDDTIRTIAENTAADANIGNAIAAIDGDSENLAYLLSGTDASSFTIDGDTGQLKTSAALDYETKTSYEVTVTVSDGSLEDEITVTINVANVNEAPVFSGGESITRQVDENTAAGTDLGSVITATDPDADDSITYSLGGTDAASFDIVSTSGQLQTEAALDYEAKNSHTVTVTATDTGDATDTITVTITVADVNEAPAFDGISTTRSIAENTGSGVNIGAAVSATDLDTDDMLEYSLGGTDAASFDIGSTNGQLRTKAALDYETKDEYSVTVSVSDGNSGTDSIAVTIKVTDVHENRTPVFTDGESTERSIAENTGSGVNIGAAVSATDLDTDDMLEYSLGGTDAASFDIGSTNGQLRTKAALDYETKDEYSVTVSVSDGNSGTDSIAVTIKVTDVHENRAPVFTDGESTERSIAENTGAGVNIGDAVSATDPDTDDTLEYSLGGTDAASFDIGSTNGQLRTKAALDYETKASYSVTVSVSDGNGGTDSISVSINVTDVPENRAPAFSTDSASRSVAENTGSGVNIGIAITATDPDSSDTLEYSLGGTDASSFSIDSTSGQLRTNAALDYETKDEYSVMVSVSDGNGGTDSIAVTINITDVNEAPTFTENSPTTRSIAENTASDTNIGSAVSATDPDADDSLTYGLGGTDAASFSIDSSSGQLKTKAALDYEDDDAYEVTVIVSDDDNLSTSITVNISITDVNENTAPSFSENSFSYRISDIANASVGDSIGDPVTASDVDDDTLSYSVGGDDAALFDIDGSSGQLKITQSLIDHNSSFYSIKVIATDPDNATAEISGTIFVTRVTRQLANNPPIFDDGESITLSVAENTASGENIGSPITATDDDPDDTLTYSLEGTDAASFSIVSTSGQLQTSAALDYERKNSYSVTVKVTDDSGASNNSDTIAVTINVTDEDDGITPELNNAPVFADESTTLSVVENTASGVNIGSPITAIDDDAGDTLTYSLEGTDAASFSIVSTSGQLQTSAALDYETKNSYSVTVKVTDDSGESNNSDTIAVAINVTDVDEGITPVADRTPEIRDAIVALVDGIDNAEDVTEEHLAAITGQLSLYYKRLSTLKPGDFDGLTSVTELQLNYNKISSIPSGIFDDLTSLERLEFSGIGSQNQLLTILPPGVFDNLTNLVKLNLSYQSLSSLPVGFFENLTNLTILNLYANDFRAIPAGMFVNLTNLKKLYLGGNPVDPLPLPIILAAGENGQIKAFAQTGAPFDITVPISVTNGSIDGGATGVTIPIGSTDSETITITRTPGTTDNVIASIGTLPSIPNDSQEGRREHNGYAFTKGEPIDVFRADNSAPVFDDGLIVGLSIAERTRSFVNIGDPISATDADYDILAYTLGGSDAASFAINGVTGQLLTKAVLDYETKSSYSVTITVSDNFGGSASIDVAITITDLDETPPTVPLSARSEKVQQHLIGIIPDASTASDVLKIHLDSITSINLRANNITSLDPDDFKGLSALRSIDLSLNDLTSLPPGIFEGLGHVRSLDLEWNEFKSFTAGMLDGLTGLTFLNLEKNYVGTLPPGLFDQLTHLRELRMGYMRLTSLPLNIFDNLTDLRDINLWGNRLTSLPSRLFQGTDSLTTLNLFNNRIRSVETGLFDSCPFLSKLFLSMNKIESLPDGFLKGNGGLISLTLVDNPGAPFDFTIGLEQGVDGASGHFAKVKAVIPIGAPDLLYVRVNITNGIFLDSNNNHLLRENDKSIYLKIHRGAVESREYQLQRLPADSTNNNSVTVSITSLPTEGSYDAGYKFVRGVDRLVVIKSGDNTAPEFTEEESTSRSISETANSGINIGGPVEATDSDGDPLTYSLSGTDASSFSIDSKTGQLKTSATLDYDTKNSYSVTVSVSDGYEGTDSIGVTINITEFDDSDPDVALSSRTTKVSDAIVDAIEGVTSASDVKKGHFINVTELDLSSASISSLNADDFDGLTHLTRLELDYNSLTSLPSDIFDGLSALTYLNLQNNDLTSLPDSIFDGLSSLETLDLAGNSISSVQGDLLSGLSSLSELLLNHNNLSSLPDGFFGIGRKIDTVNVSWNTVRPLKILVSLSYVAAGQVKIVCPIGSPLLIMPNVVISSGGDAIDSETHNGLGWDAHILNPGDTESDILDIERSEGSNNAVSVTFPLITFDRDDAHSGYEYDIDESNQPVFVLPLSIPLAPTIDIPPIPEETALLSNYPNPFNPETWIPYQLSEAGDVSLTIYDMRGVVIRKLDLGHKPAGYYTDRKRAAYWDGRNALGEKVAAGVYFSTFKAGDYTATRKMIIRK